MLRSEWTSSAIAVYLATVDDPSDQTRYRTVIELAHGEVVLTITADEARQLSSALADTAGKADRARRQPPR